MFTIKARIATFGGFLYKLSHRSYSTSTDMAVHLFVPSVPGAARPLPLLVYLSGLSCSPDNCAEKGFVHAAAARHGLAVLYPDTSPRGLDLPGSRDSWDFGEAASFYLDATQPPWASNFRMESYLLRDLLPALAQFPDAQLDLARVSICGHSMGGHGALALYLRHPGRFRSASAWAPVANPSRCPWGQKAFAGYLGDDRTYWARHDATELVRDWHGPLNVLVDVGTADPFLKAGQLLPENFEAAVRDARLDGLTLRYHEGYDHSYYFISTFADDHVAHAAKFLNE